MAKMNSIINAFVIISIGIVYWFFFGKKEPKNISPNKGNILIKVAGGYRPEHITVPVNQPTKLIFHRTDPSSCLEEVIIPDFNVKAYLSLNQKTTITINPQKIGTYRMSCGMNMFHGKITVQEAI